jgi:uncharacterized protein YtpQ (UPF0354 family)
MTMDRDAGAGPPTSAYDPHLASSAPEHDWAAAARVLFPVLRPPGTAGTPMASFDRERLALEFQHPHAQPLLDPGPADLALAYVLRTEGFDILVNADHLMGWQVEPKAIRDAALGNLRSWSAEAAWTDELSGSRRLLASDTGGGSDAARILLPEVRTYLVDELGDGARVLVGLPNRDLLVAGALRTDDAEFLGLFSTFVVEAATDADEPIDPRTFELTGDELVPTEAPPA